MDTRIALLIIAFAALLGSCNERDRNERERNNVPKAKTQDFEDISEVKMEKEQTIYVPIYSSIYTREENTLVHLTATLSIRNTSLKYPIAITEVNYYDTNGELVKNYSLKPFSLGPLGTKDFVVREWELAGGTGANFIVKWKSQYKVSHPIIQAVMISMKTGVGISFICEGKEIEE